MFLEKYGLNRFKNIDNEKLTSLARITAQHNKLYTVATLEGEKKAEVSGRFIHSAGKRSEFPVVGDWVILRDGVSDAVIESVLPRVNSISRSAAGTSNKKSEVKDEQVIAANIDCVVIVSALDRDYNPRRIERYLTIAYNSSAKPVILLNKTDLCDEVESKTAEIESIAFGVPIVAVSALKDESLDEIKEHLKSGETSVLVGSSGVGKSTLINALIGQKRQEVKGVSNAVGKGVHTTTHRELFILPDGAILIDNPGMRELGVIDSADSIKDVFSEIEELSENCRFNDCTHSDEPGCAVKKAIEEGKLEEKRFESYLKLKAEQDYLKMRENKSADAIEREKWKDIRVEVKRMYKDRKDRSKF